jgi:hypothetical protein
MIKKIILVLLVTVLTGCATYDWTFNKAHERAQLTEISA